MNAAIALAVAKSYVAESLEGAGAIKGQDGIGILSIEQTKTSNEENGINEITVTLTNGSRSIFTIVNGSHGRDGVDGARIEAIVRTEGDGSPGTTDVYTVYMTDGNTGSFTVYNGRDGIIGKDGVDGKDGIDGSSIKSIERTGGNGAPGSVDTYTVALTNGDTYSFTVYNGTDGQNGENGKDGKDGTNGKDGVNGRDGTDGVGIDHIERTSGDGSAGTIDTYTITLTDGSSYQFTVRNGADGEGGGGGQATIMVDGILKGDGTGNVVSAVAGVDYALPGENSGCVQTVNGKSPDENGNVEIEVGGGGGTFVGTIAFTVTLPMGSWVNDTLTVTSDHFVASDYAYLVTPTPASYIKYMASEVYAIDVMKDGEMTFHCAVDPKSDLIVNVLRMDVVV